MVLWFWAGSPALYHVARPENVKFRVVGTDWTGIVVVVEKVHGVVVVRVRVVANGSKYVVVRAGRPPPDGGEKR